MGRLRTCCCCASTRTGSIITGSLGIILSIITIILIWLMEKHNISYRTFIFDADFDKKMSDLDIPRIILTVNLCFTILICSLLIVAVLKKRSWLMLPFVVLGVVLAIGLLISILHTSITYYLDDIPDHNLYATVILIGGLIYLCIYLYLWAVVFSHYLDIRDEEERGRYRKAPYKR
ncbi:lysosomal-associated transmembrane protein 4A-like isoform X2 [Aricia agestis]|uniref:lysosomal-associated transmembrane protein 4A-like isoform X2 n=1 Tax=Aricia agestis TaxID=91739 RepID=UPI001C203449|nr:lysosomal-associated transmembrane protein 4A-like isoform X2 [Aricia agestis]